SLLVGISVEEVRAWREGYTKDEHFAKVLAAFQTDDLDKPSYPQYILSDEGLLYFEDWNGSNKLCVPDCKQLEVMKEAHDQKTEGAHGG
ncbi:hypothetical protein OH76DRAFT_1329269, partial [Lentinus brumalis]